MTVKKELGRSMLEMLGVLAIIGMLAIGGVWGVGKAFTKHNANNLIEDVRLAGFIVADEMFETVLNADGDVALNDKITPQTNYIFKAFAEENSTTTFGILAQNVPFNVCEEVRKRKVDWLEEIRPNGLDNVCKEDNEISFFFNTELGKYPELENNTCRSNRDCPSDKPYCRNGYCTKCEDGIEVLNGTCEECASYIGNTFENFCHTSCGTDYFFENGKYAWRRCFKCNFTGWAPSTTEEECMRCNSDRCYDETTNKCFKVNSSILNEGGICRYKCPQGQFVNDMNGIIQCLNCPSLNGTTARNDTAEFCHACGDNYFWTGRCTGCNYAGAYDWAMSSGSLLECARCPNRYFDMQTQKCLLCPTGKKASDDGLSCVDE